MLSILMLSGIEPTNKWSNGFCLKLGLGIKFLGNGEAAHGALL